jgi:hypothetical protein
VVNVGKAIQYLAFRRNAGQGRYAFPDWFDFVYP